MLPQLDSTYFIGQIIWTVLHFALLYFGVMRLVLPRAEKVLETREQTIAADLNTAEKLSKEVDYLEAQWRQHDAAARAKYKHTRDDLQKSMAIEATERRAASDHQLSQKIADAKQQLDAAWVAANQPITRESEKLAEQLLGQLFPLPP